MNGSSLVTDLGDADLDKVCAWMESTLGLQRGATPEDNYTGTWSVARCATGESVFLWGSPSLCIVGLKSGNAVECLDLDVLGLESCIKSVADDLCLIGELTQCRNFDYCYKDIVED